MKHCTNQIGSTGTHEVANLPGRFQARMGSTKLTFPEDLTGYPLEFLKAQQILWMLALAAFVVSACVAPVQPAPVTDETAAHTTVSAAAPTTNLTDGCIEAFDPNVDYFPQKATLTHTDGFTVEYQNSYKVITVKTPWPGATHSSQYVLVQCGAPAPTGFDSAQVIETPVKSIVTMSTSYLPFLEAYNVLDRLVAVDDVTYVNNATVIEMEKAGKLAQIGYGAGVNVEKLIELQPDLILTYGSGSPDYDAHPVLLNAGLKVAVNAEWLETSPLGRAEWGKFIAAFFNQEAAGETFFAETVARYQELASQANAVDNKPTVFTDTEYQGTWYVAGGKSFTAQFLADAGANYLWADDESTGGIPLAFEAVFDKAATADYWINIGFSNSLEEMKAADSRYGDFAAFQQGNVWNNNARQNANGGNDYYESAVAHPDVVLADLIAIFHPQLLPDHAFVYYQQLK